MSTLPLNWKPLPAKFVARRRGVGTIIQEDHLLPWGITVDHDDPNCDCNTLMKEMNQKPRNLPNNVNLMSIKKRSGEIPNNQTSIEKFF